MLKSNTPDERCIQIKCCCFFLLFFLLFPHENMLHNMGKRLLCYMHTANFQMSMCTHASDLDILCQHILQYPLILWVGNEGIDQPVQMHRLIRACIVSKLHKGHFLALRIICCWYSLESLTRACEMKYNFLRGLKTSYQKSNYLTLSFALSLSFPYSISSRPCYLVK